MTACIADRSDALRSAGTAGSPAALEGVVGKLRGFLLGLLFLGIVGSAAELVLLKHWVVTWQLVPFFAMGLGLVTGLASTLKPAKETLRLHQFVMLIFIAAGLIGIYLHFATNMEFELELDPSIHGFRLFWNSLKGATPTLAPGLMAQLGLLGLAYTYRHPRLRKAETQQEGGTS